MNIINKIFGFSSKGKSCQSSIDKTSSSGNSEKPDLESSRAASLVERYSDLDDEQLYRFLEEKESNGGELSEDEQKFLETESWMYLGITLYEESMYGRSLAVRELVENSYQILPDEYGNPFKELINFTLKYFKYYYGKNYEKTDKMLIRFFPMMHPYIKTYIFQLQAESVSDCVNFDEQKAFQEFLVFCKRVFTTPFYADKRKRDEQIKKYFKLMYRDVIAFIEKPD